MKRLVCSALLLVLLAAPRVQAQTIDLGVKGGLNVADVSTDVPEFETIGTDAKTGLVAGAWVAFGLGGMLAIQPEVLYSEKGFEAQEAGVEAQFKVNYFEVPLLLKLRFPSVGVRPAVYAGPVISFETSCKLGLSEGGVSADFDCDSAEADIGDRKSTDFGGVFGANLDFFVGPVMLTLDGRYQIGLTNINDDPTTSDESVKNRLWQFMAGVGISL